MAIRLHAKPFLEHMLRRIFVDRRNRSRQRNAFRTGAHAVLRVAAAFDTAVVHQRFQTLLLVHFTSRMSVEQAHLRDRCRSDKASPVIHVRACLQANAASHAFGQLVRPLTLRLRHARSRTEIIRTVDRNPCFNAFEGVKHPLTIDDKIADDRERAHRLQAGSAAPACRSARCTLDAACR